MTRLTRALLLATCSLAASAAAIAAPHAPATRGVSTVAVYGDAPYGTSPTDTAQLQATPAFIASINADPDVSLVMHAGDIHSGKQYCTAKYDHTIRNLWNTFADPMIYTPGDNEWTDCHKTGEGGGAYNSGTGQIDYMRDAQGRLIDYAGGNPVANLGLIRGIFFDRPGHTIGGKRLVKTQSEAFDPRYPSDAEYVENVMFTQSRVQFVTVNQPGGSNDDNDVWYGAPQMSTEQSNEMATRDQANLHWIDAAFDKAVAERAKAVVIMLQADMWDAADNPLHQSAFEPLIEKIATRTAAFGKPVLLFNGDSHVYRSDNPLKHGAPCVTEPGSGQTAVPCPSDDWEHHPFYDVSNFHRITVHGSTFPLEWLKLTVDPAKHSKGGADGAFGPFAWARQTQN
ncbi:MAG: metallophosphoesterase [Alphaproteobacteria bacterium]|nr:metallophosphoesterase [Alphaproteobacteria bacterium]